MQCRNCGNYVDDVVMDLDSTYCARDLLNKIRACMFPGRNSCIFRDNGNTYEVRLSIQKISSEGD